MVDAAPFRALRYDPAVTGDPLSTSAPARDDLDRFDYARHRTAAPYTVLELLTPDVGGGYQAAGAALRRWRRTGVLVEDPDPAFFAYEHRDPARPAQRGLLAAVRVGDGDGVLPHEDVDAGRVAARVARLRAVPADLAPVYTVAVAFPPALRALIAAVLGRPALVELTDEGGITHRVVPAADPGEVAALRANLAGVRAVIADGHHRWAAALAGAEGAPADDPRARTLAVVVDADHGGPEVLPVHRLLRRLPEGWRERVAADVAVAPGPLDVAALSAAAAAAGGGTVGLRLPGSAHLLRPRDEAALRALLPAGSPAWRGLDTALTDLVLLPRLGVAPGEVEPRADTAAAEQVDAGRAAALAVLAPPDLATVRAVAVAGERMPPKSTSFRPKPRTGLVMRSLEPLPRRIL